MYLSNIKQRIEYIMKNYFGFAILAIMLPYLIFAAGYNMLCQDIIAQRMSTLKSVVQAIEPLRNYETSEITRARSRALISRIVTLRFFSDENPNATLKKYSKYFKENNWNMEKCDYKRKILVVKNREYVITLVLSKNEKDNNETTKIWEIYASFNDFLTKYNL